MIFLIYMDIVGPLIPLAFLVRKRNRKAWENIVLYYLLMQLFLNGIAKYMMLQGLNNIYIYVANSLLSCVFAGVFFERVFRDVEDKRIGRVSKIFFSLSLAILATIIAVEDVSFFNSLSFSFTAFAISFFCILYYLGNLLNTAGENVIMTGRFWMVTALFVYYAGNFFVFLTYKILTSMDPHKFRIVWGFHNSIFFIFCCITLMAVGWKRLKT